MITALDDAHKEWIGIHQGEHAWEYGADFIGGLIYEDSDGIPRVAAGAWKRCETHILCDSSWSTPGMRNAVLIELHEAMAADMRSRGFGEAITWGELGRYASRLGRLGWQKITEPMWGRRL